MNKFGKLTFCAVMLASASGCNRASDDNVQALNEAQAVNEVLQNGGELVAPEEPGTNLDATQPATNTASEPRPKARADDTRRPPPKATRPQPEPDPHAGHDMGNMANMSHD